MPTIMRQRLLDDASRLRLQTTVRLRWFAVLGQIVAVSVIYFGFGFQMPIGLCLAVIALSAWLNVFLRIRFSSRHRLGYVFATLLLAYDVVQLAALLYLTGGVQNPFTFLIVAPVIVSAASLPPRNTVLLGAVTLALAAVLVWFYRPLPWMSDEVFTLPLLYRLGILAAVATSMTFLALYAYRLSREARQMSAALVATENVLAREQRLHALDGLAAAAAHELGTPLGTITLVASELEREVPADSPFREDVALLRSQARRCREILQKLTRQPGEEDPLHARLPVTQLINEAADAYRGYDTKIVVDAVPYEQAQTSGAREPVGRRRPGVIYGLGNIIENAVDFAGSRVNISARWDAHTVALTIADDGPGFPADVMEALGEPYVTTRPSLPGRQDGDGMSGMGLGFFIAKTLLERSGAELDFSNRAKPLHGAVVRISWSRDVFDITGTETSGSSLAWPVGVDEQTV